MQHPLQKKHPIRLDFAVSMTIFIFMYDIHSKLRENSIKKKVFYRMKILCTEYDICYIVLSFRNKMEK